MQLNQSPRHWGEKKKRTERDKETKTNMKFILGCSQKVFISHKRRERNTQGMLSSRFHG